MCELACPSYLLTQDFNCVKECSEGYKLYENKCYKNNLSEMYETTLDIIYKEKEL